MPFLSESSRRIRASGQRGLYLDGPGQARAQACVRAARRPPRRGSAAAAARRATRRRAGRRSPRSAAWCARGRRPARPRSRCRPPPRRGPPPPRRRRTLLALPSCSPLPPTSPAMFDDGFQFNLAPILGSRRRMVTSIRTVTVNDILLIL